MVPSTKNNVLNVLKKEPTNVPLKSVMKSARTTKLSRKELLYSVATNIVVTIFFYPKNYIPINNKNCKWVKTYEILYY